MAPNLNSAEAAARVDELIALTERLTSLVAEQARCFEARRPQDAARLLDEVGRLANTYRHESAKIRAAPGFLQSLAAGQKTRLRQTMEAFDAVLARQARAVMAAKVITEGLVKAIAEEVATQRGRGSVYGASGATAPPAATATAITLNQRA